MANDATKKKGSPKQIIEIITSKKTRAEEQSTNETVTHQTVVIRQYGDNSVCIGHVETLNL